MTISATTLTTTSTTSKAPPNPNAALGRDAFFKLMIEQLKYQDPMKPMDDKDFIGQMAQFDSLSKMESVAKGMDTLLMLTGLTQASNLIGKTVSYKHNLETLSGVVSKVTMVKGQAQLQVGDRQIGLSDVIDVTNGGGTL